MLAFHEISFSLMSFEKDKKCKHAFMVINTVEFPVEIEISLSRILLYLFTEASFKRKISGGW